MAFTSLYFLVFVLAVVFVYYIVPVKVRWGVLLAASYAFYLMSSPKTFIFILFTTVVTFLGGRAIGGHNKSYKAYIAEHGSELTRDEKKARKAQSQKKKRRVVALLLLANFGVLAIMKYFRYYLQALGIGEGIFDAGFLIPLGISFYTFQSVAYIIDLYRNKFEADQNILKFALFVSFFPQIMQGPISRYDQLAGQLYEGHKFSYRNLSFGAQLILWAVSYTHLDVYKRQVLCLLVLLLELFLIRAIVMMEYKVHAMELTVKKLLGYNGWQRYRKILLLACGSTLASILTAAAIAQIWGTVNFENVIPAGSVVMCLELLMIDIYTVKLEKYRIPEILKGGFL